jgi:hypothetical protein
MDSSGDFRRPPSRSTAKVEAFRIRGKILERKDVEVSIEQLLKIVLPQLGLVESCPFIAEIGDGLAINVARASHAEIR